MVQTRGMIECPYKTSMDNVVLAQKDIPAVFISVVDCRLQYGNHVITRCSCAGGVSSLVGFLWSRAEVYGTISSKIYRMPVVHEGFLVIRCFWVAGCGMVQMPYILLVQREFVVSLAFFCSTLWHGTKSSANRNACAMQKDSHLVGCRLLHAAVWYIETTRGLSSAADCCSMGPYDSSGAALLRARSSFLFGFLVLHCIACVKGASLVFHHSLK